MGENLISEDYNIIRELDPKWTKSCIKISRLKGGLFNKTYIVEDEEGKRYKVRIPSRGSEFFVNRDAEIMNLRLLEFTGVVPRVVEYKEDSKIAIFEFIPGIPLSKESFKNSEIMKASIKAIKTIHNSGVYFSNTFNVFLEVNRYYERLKKDGILKEYWYIANEYPLENFINITKYIENIIKKSEIREVPCHNDLLPANFILSKNKVYIIDWEFSGMNDPCFDFANFLAELEILNDEEEKKALELYFGDKASKVRERIDFYKFVSRVFWGLWAMFQFRNSELEFDFENWCRFQFNEALRYLKRLKEFWFIKI